MAVNKVIYYGEVLVDMSTVTVKPETLGKGETALDASGEMITGTAEIGVNPKLQAKSVTPSETAQTVKPDSGFDGLSSVAVGAISKTYVGSSVPKQAAQTITPGTADKTVASGRYLTGTQTIKGDSNLKAENIKQGVSIFGVAGSYEGSGGGSSEGGGSVEACTVEILAIGPVMDTTFYFIDTDGAVQYMRCSSTDLMMGVQLVVQGNSPLVGNMYIGSVNEPEGGAIRMGSYCYYITGDATVYIGG